LTQKLHMDSLGDLKGREEKPEIQDIWQCDLADDPSYSCEC
jgi:hypothetical protein